MRIFGWFRRGPAFDEDDFEREVQSHLALAARDRMDDGAPPREAEQASRREFGNLTLTAEAARRVWRPRWLETLASALGDLRFAFRVLAKEPLFVFTSVAVLTLGIGLNAAIFALLKSAVISPLSGVTGSARIAVVYGETQAGREVRLSYPDFVQLRDRSRAFRALFASSLLMANLGRGAGSRQVSAELVTGNYFDALGVPAQLGRVIRPSDENAPGGSPVVVLADSLWRRDYAADPAIVGRKIELDNFPFTVAGVAAPRFHGTIMSYDVEVFVPVSMAAHIGGGRARPAGALDPLRDREYPLVFPHGFLRSGANFAAAEAEANAIWNARAGERRLETAAQSIRVVPFRLSPTGGQTYMAPAISVLSAMGLLVFGIACANLSGLALARAVSRRGEIAVRLALGATRARVARLLLLENLLLAIPGAVLGAALAAYLVPLFVDYANWLAQPQRLHFNAAIDAPVIAFTALAACLGGLLCGLLPAMRGSHAALAAAVNEEASPRAASRGRLRSALVASQVAVSLLLIFCAGLASRTVDAARRTHPGFDPNPVGLLALDVRQNGYDRARGRDFYRRLLHATRADLRVASAALASNLPLGMVPSPERPVAVDGYRPRRGEDLAFMNNAVGPGYFEALRIRLAAGREFEERDDETAEPCAIVNETFARRFWGAPGHALGKRIHAAGAWRKVIGVAHDVKYMRIDETPRPYVYLPFLQAYRPDMILHVRGAAPAAALAASAREWSAALDAGLPVLFARPMVERTRSAFIFYDLTAAMLSVFGAAGLGLAAMGIYGLVAYTVKRSTREIGIRIALGASTARVAGEFLARGLRLGALGSAIGLLAALGAGRLLSGVLFGVGPADPFSIAFAAAVVLAAVAAATFLPAWRASRTDPVRALRYQ